MTDFELQRRLRDLRVPLAPGRDLFPAIAARIDGRQMATTRIRRRSPWLYVAAAAILVSVITAVGIGQMATQRADSHLVQRGVDPATLPGMSAAAVAAAPGGDPRLAAAAMVIEHARTQLEQAIAERPDAVFLVSLMNRTNAQHMKLERLGSNG
ncbi:MAG: hypothetical protein WBP11_15710 [Dokdonella sp.]